MLKGMNNGPTVIPIAGGKGGIGKTILAANTAVTLAYAGYRTIAIDLDLGGSNLHFQLGLKNRYAGIGDFIRAKKDELAQLAVATEIENLSFIPGDGRTPFMANINVADKVRLMEAITTLPADYVVLDLGAGSSFNTLDFFRLAGTGIVVTTPEPTAIMNLMTFCKNLVYRAISVEGKSNEAVAELVRSFIERPIEDQGASLTTLFEEITKVDATISRKMRNCCSRIRPRLVFNRGNHPSQLQVVASMEKLLYQRLGLKLDCLGFVFNDDTVLEAIKRRTILIKTYPECLASRCIVRLAKRVTRVWNGNIINGRGRLLKDTQKVYDSWVLGSDGQLA